ncbi:hypothetical protein Tco_0685241 [Tanacetum coccineum]
MKAVRSSSHIGFNSTIELASFDESQVVTLNANSFAVSGMVIAKPGVVRFFVRMELSCFVDEVFDSGFVEVQEVVQQVKSWKHVCASKEEFVLVGFSLPENSTYHSAMSYTLSCQAWEDGSRHQQLSCAQLM